MFLGKGRSVNRLVAVIDTCVLVNFLAIGRVDLLAPHAVYRFVIANCKGKHLPSLYQHAVCSEAPVTTAAGTVVAPLSFISAAAGVALAAELVKGGNPELAEYALDNYFRFDTLAAPNPEFRQLRLPDPTGRCVCHDPDFGEVYRERHPAQGRLPAGT